MGKPKASVTKMSTIITVPANAVVVISFCPLSCGSAKRVAQLALAFFIVLNRTHNVVNRVIERNDARERDREVQRCHGNVQGRINTLDLGHGIVPVRVLLGVSGFFCIRFLIFDVPHFLQPFFPVQQTGADGRLIDGKGSIIVHPIKGVVVSMDIWQRTTFTEDLGISGEASFSHDFTPGGIPVFSILPFVWIYGEVGLFFKIGGRLALEEHWKQSLSYKIHYENSYLPALGMFTSIPKFTISDVDLTTERKGQFMFEGSAASGVYGEIGVALLAKKLLSSGFRFEAGVEVGGEIMLYNSDKDVAQYSTSVYEKLRATELYVKPFCKVGLEARMLSVGKGDINIFERKWTGDTFKLVPSFANTTLIREPSDPHLLKASTKAFARSLFPCDLGFRLIKEGSDTSTDCNNLLHYANTPQTYEHYFTIEDFGKKYTLFPIVELLGLGINMRALPSAELNPPEPYYVWDEANKTAKYYYDGMYDSRGGWKINEYSHNVRNSSLKVIFDESFSNYYPKYFFSFNRCSELQSIENLKYLKTDSITSMSGMFYECKSLTSLDLGNFNTANVTDMSGMFANCQSLRSLDLSSFNTLNVTNMSGMFGGCLSLVSLNLSSFNTSNVTNMGGGYVGEQEWRGMFYGCSSLTSLDLSSFNTSKVTNMDLMFCNCSSLTSLNLSNFNTANVKKMSNMFGDCKSLTTLDLRSFNTSNVTTMSAMFVRCSSLRTLNLSSFNTTNVTSMSNMFSDCKSLTTLDLSSFNTSNVKGMPYMFRYCSSLKNLDLRNFNTANVKEMDGMFSKCSSLKNLDLSNFNTSNVTTMSSMFSECSSLTSLDLTSFDTSNVKDMIEMFHWCKSLTSLDLTSFDTSNVIDMYFMFSNCSSLETIYAENWNCPSGAFDYIFNGCHNLTGGMGTKIGENIYGHDNNGNPLYYNCPSNSRAAHIDGGKDWPGLFTEK